MLDNEMVAKKSIMFKEYNVSINMTFNSVNFYHYQHKKYRRYF